MTPITLPCSDCSLIWKLRYYLWMARSQHPVSVKNKKNILWNTFRLTSSKKPQLLSVWIFFKFVHPCLRFCLLCYTVCLLVIFLALLPDSGFVRSKELCRFHRALSAVLSTVLAAYKLQIILGLIQLLIINIINSSSKNCLMGVCKCRSNYRPYWETTFLLFT